MTLRIVWDSRKSAKTYVERGFDFAFAAGIFASPTVERADTRRDYGEARYVAIGRVADITLTLVYTDRVADDGSPERRIISARVSTRRERKTYDEAYPQS